VLAIDGYRGGIADRSVRSTELHETVWPVSIDVFFQRFKDGDADEGCGGEAMRQRRTSSGRGRSTASR